VYTFPTMRHDKIIGEREAKLLHAGLDELEQASATTARTMTHTGSTNLVLAALGYPDWAYRCSGQIPGRPLPNYLAMVDELRVVANLFERIPPARIFAIPLTSARPAINPRILAGALSAPDLLSILDLIVSLGNTYFPGGAIDAIETSDALVMTARLTASTARAASVIEILWLISYAKIALIYGAHLPAGISNATIELRTTLPSDMMAGFLVPGIDLRCGCELTQMLVPALLLRTENPVQDKEEWVRFEARSKMRVTALESIGHSAGPIMVAIQKSLRNLRRAPRLNEIARDLGMSERTLARRLAQGGASFTELLNLVRKEMVREMLLSSSTMNIAVVAKSLGYSETTSFVRAFRSWYGVSPKEWIAASGSHNIGEGS